MSQVDQTSAPAAATPSYPHPPYLHWPVSRREFYRAIWMAMIPCLAWSAAIFGFRSLAILVAAVAGCTVAHTILKRLLRWKRAQTLMYQHSLVSAVVMAALAQPSWPAWPMACAGMLIPLLLVYVGGAGRERVHISVALAIILQYLVLPQLAQHGYFAGSPDAILARDRLVMGDLRQQSPMPPTQWRQSVEISGNDAMAFRPPAHVAIETIDGVADILPPPRGDEQRITPEIRRQMDAVLYDAIALRLPTMDAFMAGIAPNRIGCASLIGAAIAGLYLSYRYILRPRSVLIFLISFILASYLFAFSHHTVFRVGFSGLGELFAYIPEELVTLLNYQILGSDAAFAAVFILALPGTEPLGARSRRMFLITAAILAALLHRIAPGAPAASLVLCALMPAAPLFDWIFVQRSWLNV